MLEELHVKNFAIIDDLSIKFGNGMNIFTGETGAGKSIIVDAIELIVGGKSEPEMIRSGFEESEIEASFNTAGLQALISKLKELELYSGDELIIRRVIAKSGKSRAYINGKLCPLSLLKEVGSILIDIHGQHQHQSLLKKETHIDYLDRFGGLLELREKFSKLYFEYQQLKNDIKKLEETEKVKAERLDFLNFQIREIEEAKLEPDEENKLKTEKQILTNAEKFVSLANEGSENLYSKDGSVIEVLNLLKKKTSELRRFDSSLEEVESLLDSCIVQLNEVVAFLQKYNEKFNYDPNRLEEIESRLALIGRLKKKYGDSVDSILIRLKELKNELRGIESADEELKKLQVTERELYAKMKKEAEKLTKMRLDTSKKLKQSIELELKALGMEKAVFNVAFNTTEFTAYGADDVEFLLSTNPGEDVKPLTMIVSGGELSRIMLALKNILAGYSGVPVLIFDEIDSGIGGAIAEVVGKKLKELSSRHQVLCVTHLPQIACYAKSHFSVSKGHERGRTVTKVKLLEKSERVDELARMLSGVELTKKSREYAKELLERIS
jgi:DNA repair protein RecN (Recombination protein N)